MYWTHSLYKTDFHCDVDGLIPYMFCIDDKIQEECDLNENEPIISYTVEPQKESVIDKCKLRLMFVHKCQDPLFWSIYLAKHGKNEYNRIGLDGNEEMKEKNAMSQFFHKMGATQLNTILQTKITKSGCSNMASSIVSEPRLSWTSLYIVCAFYNCNLYIVDLQKKTYLTYLRQNPEQYDTYVLYRNRESGPHYYIDTSEQLYTFEYIHNHFVWIISYEKPFKAASNYKLQELEHFAHMLGIEYEPKTKKADLFAKVALHCSGGNIGSQHNHST